MTHESWHTIPVPVPRWYISKQKIVSFIPVTFNKNEEKFTLLIQVPRQGELSIFQDDRVLWRRNVEPKNWSRKAWLCPDRCLRGERCCSCSGLCQMLQATKIKITKLLKPIFAQLPLFRSPVTTKRSGIEQIKRSRFRKKSWNTQKIVWQSFDN